MTRAVRALPQAFGISAGGRGGQERRGRNGRGERRGGRGARARREMREMLPGCPDATSSALGGQLPKSSPRGRIISTEGGFGLLPSPKFGLAASSAPRLTPHPSPSGPPPGYLDEVERWSRLEDNVLVVLLVLHVLLQPMLFVDLLLLHQVEECSGGHGHRDGVLGLGLRSERRVAPVRGPQPPGPQPPPGPPTRWHSPAGPSG